MRFLYQRPQECGELSRKAFLDRICRLLRAVAHDLGNAFNGLQLLRSMAEFHVPDSVEWVRQNECDRARLLFQCVLLCIDSPADLESKFLCQSISDDSGSKEQLRSFQVTLSTARKVVLHWLCEDFARFYEPTTDGTTSLNGIIGAGVADYSSILDGVTSRALSDWEKIVRALLFLEPPQSPCLQEFLSLDTSCEKLLLDDLVVRVRLCFELGGNIDDEMIRIAVDAAIRGDKRTPPAISLGILEHLFHGCRKDRRAVISLKDPMLLWELYQLVEYTPCRELHRQTTSELDGVVMDISLSSLSGGVIGEVNAASKGLPRLAYPGLWWRATGLALIMCGASPSTIGQTAWKEHPTLQTLIKMVTSDRYRFPTVDCDDAGREAMRNSEQKKRDDEARITEFLFLPPGQIKPKDEGNQTTEISFGGSRSSKRQQEKERNI